MSVTDIVGIAGLVLAVLGIAISIYYGRKALNPTQLELQWRAESTRLLPEGIANNDFDLKVQVNDEEVKDPHFTQLELRNTGKLDIQSPMFDKNRPLSFYLEGVTFFQIINPSGGLARTQGQIVNIGPERLPRGSSWVIKIISDGEPVVTLHETHLANVNVKRFSIAPRNVLTSATLFYERISVAASSAGAIGIITAIIAALTS